MLSLSCAGLRQDGHCGLAVAMLSLSCEGLRQDGGVCSIHSSTVLGEEGYRRARAYAAFCYITLREKPMYKDSTYDEILSSRKLLGLSQAPSHKTLRRTMLT